MGRRGSALVLGVLACASCRFDASSVGETEAETSATATTMGTTVAVPSGGHGDTSGSATVVPTTTGDDGGEPSTSSSGPGSSSSDAGRSSDEAGSSSGTTDGLAQIEYCTVAGLAIPDDDTDGATASIDVDLLGGGVVTSLQLLVQASHPFVGDLRFDLRKGDAEIVVIDRPGGGDCNGNDIDVVLHDAAPAPVGTSCLDDGAGPPALGGELLPEYPMNPAFVGQQMLGTWRLRATDTAAADTGTLDAWCLRITYQ